MSLSLRLATPLLAALALLWTEPPASAAKPLTIGFDMSLTGAIAPNGKAALLAMQIWAEDINANGGLLGRPVKLVYYDDQSNPALVPQIVTKLLDVDKVDLLIGGNGTNLVAPALSVAMQRNLTLIGLFGLDVNSRFHYPRYFSIIPAGGPNPTESFAEGFFAVAAQFRCWGRRSKASAAWIRRSWPSTCARIVSAPSRARSASAPTPSGRSRACWRYSSRA